LSVVSGAGVDVLDVGRMRRALGEEAGSRAVFTPVEIADCDARPDPPRHYAARFAAKEALLKGLGLRPPDLAVFRDIEVRVTREGATVALRGRVAAAAAGLGTIRPHLSLAHTSDHAIATVIVERLDRDA
jgi:holo-[acyl-carrier protein] synthase